MQQRLSRWILAGITLGVAVCNPLFAAGWVVFHSALDATLYTEPSTIIKEGSTAKMWALIDYKQAQRSKAPAHAQHQHDWQN